MPATAKTPPIRKSIRVAVPATRAFDVFTARMHRWWPAVHSILKGPRAAIAVEPRVGAGGMNGASTAASARGGGSSRGIRRSA